MQNYTKTLGKNIAEQRKKMHLTQEGLAEILDISVKHCSEVERGLSTLSLEKLIILSEKFNCSMDELIYGQTTQNPYAILPHDIVSILNSNDKDEQKLLIAYLKMYSKLRHE